MLSSVPRSFLKPSHARCCFCGWLYTRLSIWRRSVDCTGSRCSTCRKSQPKKLHFISSDCRCAEISSSHIQLIGTMLGTSGFYDYHQNPQPTYNVIRSLLLPAFNVLPNDDDAEDHPRFIIGFRNRRSLILSAILIGLRFRPRSNNNQMDLQEDIILFYAVWFYSVQCYCTKHSFWLYSKHQPSSVLSAGSTVIIGHSIVRRGRL